MQVKAYQSKDGTLHLKQEDAVESDLRSALEDSGMQADDINMFINTIKANVHNDETKRLVRTFMSAVETSTQNRIRPAAVA